MESKYDIISVGDASMDVFITPAESEALCTIDNKECLICFSYGDKIPAKRLEFSVGGNAANNAIGVSRLGLKAAIVLTVGDDSVGREITRKLENEKVDTKYVITQESSVSNYSTVINYSGERTIFVYHAPRSYEFPVDFPKAPWLYLTSMGESFSPFYSHVTDWLKKNPDVKLAFNPGSYQFRAEKGALTQALSLSYIIFINRQEAENLTDSKDTEGKEKELLIRLSKLGPKICVITDGNKGSYIYDSGDHENSQGEKFIRSGILPVDSYERTGAGDSFGSGCLAAIIKGKSFEDALMWGTMNSASVIGYTGPQKGLLKESEMPTWLDRAKSSGVKVGAF